jgi:hypothetical protein
MMGLIGQTSPPKSPSPSCGEEDFDTLLGGAATFGEEVGGEVTA